MDDAPEMLHMRGFGYCNTSYGLLAEILCL